MSQIPDFSDDSSSTSVRHGSIDSRQHRPPVKVLPPTCTQMRCLVAMSAVASPVLRHRSLRCRRRGAQGAGARALTRENWQRENRARERPTLARQRANRPTYSPVPHANGVGEGGTSQRAAPAPLGRAAAMSNPRTVCIAVAESPVAAMLLPEERSQRTPRTPLQERMQRPPRTPRTPCTQRRQRQQRAKV